MACSFLLYESVTKIIKSQAVGVMVTESSPYASLFAWPTFLRIITTMKANREEWLVAMGEQHFLGVYVPQS